MNALREAKAYLAGQVWSDKWADLHPNDPAVLLAALVEEIEAAPVVSLWVGDTDDSFVVDSPEEAQAIIDAGHTVRILAVGEQP